MKKASPFAELSNLEKTSKKLSRGMSSELVMNMKSLTDDKQTLELLDAVLAVHTAEKNLQKLLK